MDTAARRTEEPLWEPKQVAGFLGVPVRTLYKWRCQGNGPPTGSVSICATSRLTCSHGSTTKPRPEHVTAVGRPLATFESTRHRSATALPASTATQQHYR